MTEPTARREQIRRALAEADGFSYGHLEPHDYQRHADAILALDAPVPPAPADRAAVLREASIAVRRKAVHDGEDFCNGIDFAADLLCRMADEAQRDSTQPKAAADYGDGKGRAYCLACAHQVGADVPLTVENVDYWELCPSCGRRIVEVARSGRPAPDDIPARQARWEAAALAAGRVVDRNALRVYMAVADAEQAALAADSAQLAALHAHGVDNWDGYEDALSGVEPRSDAVSGPVCPPEARTGSRRPVAGRSGSAGLRRPYSAPDGPNSRTPPINPPSGGTHDRPSRTDDLQPCPDGHLPPLPLRARRPVQGHPRLPPQGEPRPPGPHRIPPRT